MKYTTYVYGDRIRDAVQKSGKTREKIAALVQDYLEEEDLSFSLAGLDKLYRGDLPKRAPKRILEALARACDCPVSDFAESEAQTA